MVDALNFENSPEKEITIKQLVVADLVLVSKSENLSVVQSEILKETLQKINPLAEIDFFKLDKWSNIQLDSVIKKHRAEYDFACFSGSHGDISSRTLRLNQPLKKEEFIHWISYTLDIYKNDIYRTKGILCFENESYEYILQGVGGSFEIVEGEKFVKSETSVIVFIGKKIPVIQFN
ncbi:MAG: GTP-binding protein [Draconibacterium sp.]|nr:GTP-binding protein [Draconibacterium sp.]